MTGQARDEEEEEVPCLALCSNQRTCISNGQADGEMLACIHKAQRYCRTFLTFLLDACQTQAT